MAIAKRGQPGTGPTMHVSNAEPGQSLVEFPSQSLGRGWANLGQMWMKTAREDRGVFLVL
jgi:hypothetical protein